MNQGEASIRVSKALRIVGIIGVLLGIATVLCSMLLYIQEYEFSVFETYLSDIGNKPGWPQAVFNSGMLIIAPVRYLFLILLILQLGSWCREEVLDFGISHRDSGRSWKHRHVGDSLFPEPAAP